MGKTAFLPLQQNLCSFPRPPSHQIGCWGTNLPVASTFQKTLQGFKENQNGRRRIFSSKHRETLGRQPPLHSLISPLEQSHHKNRMKNSIVISKVFGVSPGCKTGRRGEGGGSAGSTANAIGRRQGVVRWGRTPLHSAGRRTRSQGSGISTPAARALAFASDSRVGILNRQ